MDLTKTHYMYDLQYSTISPCRRYEAFVPSVASFFNIGTFLPITHKHLLTPTHHQVSVPLRSSSPPPTSHISFTIRNHNDNAGISPSSAGLILPVLVTGGTRRVRSVGALERRLTKVVHARWQIRIATAMDAVIAARERDVGVSQDSVIIVAVDEASAEAAEAGAVLAGVAVGEPRDVGASLPNG